MALQGQTRDVLFKQENCTNMIFKVAILGRVFHNVSLLHLCHLLFRRIQALRLSRSPPQRTVSLGQPTMVTAMAQARV